MQNNQKITISIENTIINVNNITFSYNHKEDRMLFILNHSNIKDRIDFFVTRRMLIQLLESFDKILINHCDNGKLFKQLYNNQETLEVSAPKNANKIKDNDKKQESVTNKDEENKKTWEKSINTSELDFTKIKEPILLDSLSFNIINNNITFKYISNNSVLAISKMDILMFQRTISSMMRVIPFMSWGISSHILD